MAPALASKPTFTVVAGPNGAGKTTLIASLRDRGYSIGVYLNPDDIAARLDGPEQTKELRAGRETLRRTRELIANRESFTRETTLTSAESLRMIAQAKKAGFSVNLIVVGVDDLRTTKSRVSDRVAKGGHDIPEDIQERRFIKSFDNAAKAAKIAERDRLDRRADRARAARKLARVYRAERANAARRVREIAPARDEAVRKKLAAFDRAFGAELCRLADAGDREAERMRDRLDRARGQGRDLDRDRDFER